MECALTEFNYFGINNDNDPLTFAEYQIMMLWQFDYVDELIFEMNMTSINYIYFNMGADGR